MGDDPPKPRNRLGADELLEETHNAVFKVISLLERNGLAAESVDHLKSMDQGLDFMSALNLGQSLGLTMPSLPHGELMVLLLDAWECVATMKGNVRKQMYRKVRVLEADTKTEPEILDRWKGEREKAERESARANISFITTNQILKALTEEE
ncbi:unnamed protein product [Choristocarpus tenellus]